MTYDRVQAASNGTFWRRHLGAPFAGVMLAPLLVACFVVQIYLLTTSDLAPEQFYREYALSSQGLHEGRWWTLFTNMFLHAGLAHIWFNASAAAAIAPLAAIGLGKGVGGFIRFVVFYLLCGLAAGLTYVGFHPDSAAPALGASGAICGLFGAAVRIPFRPGKLYPLWSPKIWRAAFPFVLINIVLMAFLAQGGLVLIAWEAHLGGFVAGLILISFFAIKRSPTETVWEGPGHGDTAADQL